MSRPSAISTHASHLPHGSPVGPFTQLSARARILAVVVFPTPRGPAKIKDWASRPVVIAFFSVSTTPRWPMTSSKRCGRHLRARARWDVDIGKSGNRDIGESDRNIGLFDYR